MNFSRINSDKSEAIKILERILHWSQRKSNGCLVCYLGINTKGYSRININGTFWATHRVIMHLLTDYNLEDEELKVLHRDELCSSKACIEFNHLKIGTISENTHDRIKSMVAILLKE